jgi:alkanesulfonate monooxygenase SsuD/methylene tetrahydromethanopterin reductase-like flavin-dependent oxidoreductase (luciferase family)
VRFGIFMGPFHRVSENAALAIERDLQLVEHLDRIGFDEVWFGEHHSGGHEIVPGPEMMVAAAAQRTTRDPPSHEGMVERVIESGTGLIGTPAMAVELLERYERQSGGFGAFLFFQNEWADRTATERSFELFAREVVPRFDGRPDLRARSYAWKKANRPMLSERFVSGVDAARRQYADERAARER